MGRRVVSLGSDQPNGEAPIIKVEKLTTPGCDVIFVSSGFEISRIATLET